MYVENRYNIRSKAFLEILEEERRLRSLKQQFPLQSAAWHAVWDKLDRLLARKEAYENAVIRRRMENGCYNF